MDLITQEEQHRQMRERILREVRHEVAEMQDREDDKQRGIYCPPIEIHVVHYKP